MRIRITGKRIFGATGYVPVGTELEVDSEPKGWAGQYEVIGRNPKPDAVPITNPAKDDGDAAPNNDDQPKRRGRPRKDA